MDLSFIENFHFENNFVERNVYHDIAPKEVAGEKKVHTWPFLRLCTEYSMGKNEGCNHWLNVETKM